MTPEQISAAGAVLTLLERLGGMPIYVILFVLILGPWIGMFFFDRSNTKRFEATRKMYEDNVSLVKNYENLSCDLKDVLLLNTSEWSGAKEKLDYLLRQKWGPA